MTDLVWYTEISMALGPPPIIGDGTGLISISLLRSDMSRPSMMTFCVQTATAPTLATAQDTIDDFFDNFKTNIKPNIDSECTIFAPTIVLGKGDTVPWQATAAGGSTVGGGAAVTLTPNCALLVKRVTGFAGKRNRGRIYVPYTLVSGTVNQNGSIQAATVTAQQASWDAFLAQLTADTSTMCIPNKTFNVPLPPHYVTRIQAGNQVNSLVVESTIATQRRRLGR